MTQRKTIVISQWGLRPASLFAILSRVEGQILQIEKSTGGQIHTLSAVVEIDAEQEEVIYQKLSDLVPAVHVEGFQVKKQGPASYVMICVGPSLQTSFIKQFYLFLAKEGLSIHALSTLDQNHAILMTATAHFPVDATHVMKQFAPLHAAFGVDLLVQEETLFRFPKRLLVMDMDSTLVQTEGIDELAREAGVEEAVVAMTRRAMKGEIAFPDALRARVRLLKGLPQKALARVHQRTPLTPGARELVSVVQRLGYKTAVLSGGFDYFSSRLKKELRLDYAFSNRLEIKEGKLTGEILGEIVDGKKKLALMEEIAKKEKIPLSQVIAIGDGANDLPMITHAGMGIAFNAKPVVREAAPFSISQPSLATLLYLLGIHRREIEAWQDQTD